MFVPHPQLRPPSLKYAGSFQHPRCPDGILPGEISGKDFFHALVMFMESQASKPEGTLRLLCSLLPEFISLSSAAGANCPAPKPSSDLSLRSAFGGHEEMGSKR